MTSTTLHALTLNFSQIASHLPLPSTISLSQTHPLLKRTLPSHLTHSFLALLTSHNRISPQNTHAFRALLLHTRAVISGSTVLHFVMRDTQWTPGDFDLYAPLGTAWMIVRWLQIHEGYTIIEDGSRNFDFAPARMSPDPSEPCDWLTDLISPPNANANSNSGKYDIHGSYIHRVYKLLSPSPSRAQIDIIESITPSPIPPITKFHSTLVMNYLTPSSLVVLYPALTFARQGILQHRSLPLPDDAAADGPGPYNRAMEQSTRSAEKRDYAEKYAARGYVLLPKRVPGTPCGAACPSQTRSVAGGHVDKWALEVVFDFSASSLSSTNSRSTQGTLPRRPPLPPTMWKLQTAPAGRPGAAPARPCDYPYCPVLRARRSGVFRRRGGGV